MVVGHIKNFFTQSPAFGRNFQRWLPLIYAAWLVAVGLVFSFQLGSGELLPGHGPSEAEVLAVTESAPSLLENFLYWPYYAAVYLVRLVVEDGVLAARLVSLCLGLASAGCFLFLLRRKFGVFVSLTGASLLACNSWILSLARSGTAEISLLAGFLLLAACLVLIKKHPQNLYPKAAALILAAAGWFLPLVPWLLTAGFFYLVANRKKIPGFQPVLQIAAGLTFAVLVAFSLAALSKTPSDILLGWGIPDSLLNPWEFLQNLGQTLNALVWQAPHNPELWLGQLPFLDIFLVALLPFGIYAYRQEIKQRRWRRLWLLPAGLLLIAGLNQGIETAGLFLLLLLAVWTAAAGLDQLLTHWKTIFPTNPLAKTLGILTFLILINFSLFYQIKRYFVAWSNQPQTQEIYNLKQPSV